MSLFSPLSFWNTPLAPDAPIDPNSPAIISDLVGQVEQQVAAKNGPWIDTTAISIVPAGASTVPVALVDHSPDPVLSQAWASVPITLTGAPTDTEQDLAVYQPSTDTMWEFFHLRLVSGAWQAEWGGAIQNVSTFDGVYGPSAWPGAPTWWGVTASSLPVAGGVITLEDLAVGQINHALSITVPWARSGFYCPPAQRCDGRSTDPNALPEGACLRIPPSVNLDSLPMPRLTRMIADAAQRYGVYVRDQSGGPLAFFIQDPTGNGWAEQTVGDYYGPEAAFQLLYYLPWTRFEVLQMNLKPQD